MSLGSRSLLIVLGILALLLAPYLLWREPMDAPFSSMAYHEWRPSARSYAWLIGIALLVTDLFLSMRPSFARAGTGSRRWSRPGSRCVE
jgi:hypothetical protein